MARRGTSLPTGAGLVFIVVGVLFIAIPNWARAKREYAAAMERHVWSQGEVGFIEAAIGGTIAIFRTILYTFAAGVVEHPILTILFGLGFILGGIILVVEYGILSSDAEPWVGEFEM